MIKSLQHKVFSFIIFILLLITGSKAQVATLEANLKLIKVDGINIPFQNGMPVPSFEKQNRQIINLQGTWKKERFSADDAITLNKRDSAGYLNLISEAQGRYLPTYNDIGWTDKNIPGVENQMNPFPTVPEYYEDGVWYRKTFDTADSLNGKFIKLIFYAVNYVADVWLNGIYLGYHEGGYTPFAFDVSSVLNYGGSNVLAVRVDNPAWGTRNDIVPYVKVDWFNYAGIIHDVYLEVSELVSVMRCDIVPQNLDGTIQTTITLLNKSDTDKNADVSIEVFHADINQDNINKERASELIGNSASFTGTSQNTISIKKDSTKVWRTILNISNPLLWSPKNPNLYIMKVVLKENGNLIDEFYTQFGIRTIKTIDDKVYLNDQPVFFTGVARHEDHPIYGRSIPIDIIYEDMLKVKSVNADMLRTAHYPNHLHTYLLADRLGITIVEEIPVWWFDEELPWIIQNTLRHIHEQMFREMVFKDYNRPSIILWSTCNECLDVTNRKTYIQKVKDDLNFNYADGRLITQSAAANRPGPEDASQAVCDVAGWTLYFGIFYGTSYSGGTNNFLINAKVANPGKPILDTEFGYWSSEDNSTSDRQVKVFNDTFNSFKIFAPISTSGQYNSNGFLMGVTWWCIFDWYSHQHPNGFQSMGIFTMNRDTAKLVRDVLKNAYEPFYNMGGVISETSAETLIQPNNFSLEQNYPNPFNPVTNFEFRIADFGFVSLKIYNILGKEVAVLVNEEKSPGNYKVHFNADNYGLSSTIYFYKLTANGFSEIKKMVLIR